LGDTVRPQGWTIDMTVVGSEPGNAYEGIENGVLCSWIEDDTEHVEVFSALGMTIVERANITKQDTNPTSGQ